MKKAIANFLEREASGGICLMVAAAVALMLANSPAGPDMIALWHLPMGMLSLHGWINDGLMAIFFLLVGLELKREFLETDVKQAALPGMAALGGMIVPCGIFLLINQGSGEQLRGWAIPAATDIAFALGVLTLLGSRVPASVKLFLTALAIIDDLGAILIIGLFYTVDVQTLALLAAGLLTGGLYLLNRCEVMRSWPYLLLGAGLWFAIHESGFHATLAGVITAFTIPAAKLEDLEHALHPWVAFGILPLFALVNAGLDFSGFHFTDLAAPLPLGIMLALVVGKPLGIIIGSWLALHLTPAILPPQMTARHLLGLAILGGIGFTMSLFIADLSFSAAPLLADQARLGVLVGSFASAVTGYAILRRTT